MKRRILKVILSNLVFTTVIYSQIELVDKCGYIYGHQPNHFLARIANWGYGYDSLLIDLDRWAESQFVSIDSLGASIQNLSLIHI